MRFLYRTGSITEHTQLWWSVRVHLSFPTVEVRIADAQPDLGEARSLAALGLTRWWLAAPGPSTRASRWSGSRTE